MDMSRCDLVLKDKSYKMAEEFWSRNAGEKSKLKNQIEKLQRKMQNGFIRGFFVDGWMSE